MSCDCHKSVCEEHATHLRPFEEPCIGIIAGTCELCGKTLTNQSKYAWLPTELFERLKMVGKESHVTERYSCATRAYSCVTLSARNA